MISARKQLVVADGSEKPDAGAGRFSVSGQPRVRIFPPPELLREIDETTAKILNDKPATLVDAEPSLISIYLHWSEQLQKLTDEAVAPLAAQGIVLPPGTVKCQALFVAECFVRDFPARQDNTASSRALLFGIFARAKAGQLDLFADETPEPTPLPPRRWTRRWWKNFFQSCCRLWAAEPDRVVVSATPVPPIPPSKPVNAPKPFCRCEICSPS